MNTVVVHDTQFGNTEQVARAIAGRFEALGTTHLLPLSEATDADLAGVDLLVIGGPTQGHGARNQLRNWIADLPDSSMRGTSVAAFDTRLTWPASLAGSVARVVAKELRRHGAALVASPESFLVSGSEGPLVEGELERAAVWAETIAAKAGASAAVGM